MAAVIYERRHRSQVCILPGYTVTHYSKSHLTYLNNNTVEQTHMLKCHKTHYKPKKINYTALSFKKVKNHIIMSKCFKCESNECFDRVLGLQSPRRRNRRHLSCLNRTGLKASDWRRQSPPSDCFAARVYESPRLSGLHATAFDVIQ